MADEKKDSRSSLAPANSPKPSPLAQASSAAAGCQILSKIPAVGGYV